MFLINNYCRKSYYKSKIQLKLLIGSTSPQIIYWKPKNNLRSNTLRNMFEIAKNDQGDRVLLMPWDGQRDGILKHIHLLTTGSPVMQHGIYIKNYDSTYFSGCKNIFGSPLSAYYFLARDKYMFYVTIKLQCFDVKLQR